MSTALSQPTLDLQASPSVCDGRKFTLWFWRRCWGWTASVASIRKSIH